METGWSDFISRDQTSAARPAIAPVASERSGWASHFSDDPTVERCSRFPEDAFAIIRQPSRSPMMSGRARCGDWLLTFERRAPPRIEPMMGYTAGDDTLQQVQIRFPDKESAIRYAERQSLPFRVQEHADRTVAPKSERMPVEQAARKPQATEKLLSDWLFFAWLQARYGAGIPAIPDLERALVTPAAVFRSPAEVADHPLLPLECKREILKRWAWDERCQEAATGEGMPEVELSRFDEVAAVLGHLAEHQRAGRTDDMVLVFQHPGRRRSF